MSECDTCGLDDSECYCELYNLSERVDTLEEELDKLTNVIKAMSDYIKGMP